MIAPDVYEQMWEVAEKLAKKESLEKSGEEDCDFIEERRDIHLNNMLEIADEDSDLN